MRASTAIVAVAGALGGYAAMGWLEFFGPGAPAWTGFVVGIAATAVGVGVPLAVARHLATPVLLLVALPICGFLIRNAAEDRVLAVRGVAADCRVNDVKTTTRHVANGAPEGGSSKKTIRSVKLQCPSGGPSELRTQSAVERPGTLALTWDPRRKVDPRPTRDVPGVSTLIAPSLGALVALLLAATADPAAFRRDDP